MPDVQSLPDGRQLPDGQHSPDEQQSFGGSRASDVQLTPVNPRPLNNSQLPDNHQSSDGLPTVTGGGGRKIKVLFGNVRSLIPKFDELRGLVSIDSYDIIGINETWLNLTDKHMVSEVGLPGYTIFNADRPTPSGRGSGSLLYIKQTLQPVLKTLYANETCEMIGVKIKLSNDAFIKIVLVYRNSHILVDSESLLYEKIEETVSSMHETVIFGDFNLPNINWNTLTSQAPGNRLLDLISSNGLVQHVKEPTRGNNILDLVITSEDQLVNEVEISDKIRNGDHNMLIFNIEVRHNPHDIRVSKPNFGRADFDELSRLIRIENFSTVLDEMDADTGFQHFKNRLEQLSKQCIPRKTIRKGNIKTDPPWWNRELKTAIEERQRLHRQLRTNPTPDNRQLHITACRNVNRINRASKRTKEIQIARSAKYNVKEFYRYVNDRRIVRDSIGPLNDTDGSLKTDDADIARILNSYFSTVFTVEDTSNIPNVPERETARRLEDVIIIEEQVMKKLNELNAYKSFGPDGVHPRILKETREVICTTLTKIFNKSLTTGIVPEDWRLANVTAIFKKGDRKDAGNYRPVSLTSVPCKTMERIMKDYLVDHLETNNLIKDTQHGFRCKRSCLTNLLDFFNTAFEIYDNCKAVDVVYLDFQKAFDKVPHHRLLRKISAMGVGGNVLRWIEAWLSGRKQRVCINQAKSEWAPVTSGVPQGSVLGPVLFIIYIDDLDNGLLTKITKFADDTKLCHPAITDKDRRAIQEDLDKLVEWSETWQMQFNLSKCNIMHIGCHNSHNNYTMTGSNLKLVHEQKDLGIRITDDLKWDTQVKKSFNKANRVLGLISRNFHYKHEDIMMPLYKSLVRPHLEYAVQFWSPHLRKDIIKLERIQRRATKMIPALRNKSYPDRLKELGLITLEKRRLRGQLIETFKYLKGFNNVSPAGLFDRDFNERNRNNGQKLVVKRFQTTIKEHFFPIEIAQIWNRLPHDVVESDTINTFKNRLDKFWLENTE